ncbi:MAG: hypothetical protein RR702_03150 [Clostridia bacterium]
MEEKEQVNYKIMICVILFIVTILVAAVALYFVWKPVKAVAKPGKLDYDSYKETVLTETNFLEQYVLEINTLLQKEDYDTLYSMLYPEYKERYNVTRESLETFIKARKLNARELTIGNINLGDVEGKMTYRVQVSSPDLAFEGNYMVYEYSPRDYKIGFQDYIYESNDTKEYIRSGIAVTVTKKQYGISNISLQIKVKNTNDNRVIINQEAESEPFYSIHKMSKPEGSTATMFVGKRIGLNPGDEMSGTLNFKIIPMTHKFFKGFKLKGVVLHEGEQPTNLDFEI